MTDRLTHELEYRKDNLGRYRSDGQDIIATRRAYRIVLCGMGALGSRLLDLLACQGYENLVGIDYDRVEHHNLGTQIYGLADVGRKKSTQAANAVFRRLKVSVEGVDAEIKPTNAAKLLSNAGLVVDLLDNHEGRNLIRDTCAKLLIPCLHIGLSGDGFAEIEWNDVYRAHPVLKQDAAPCDYPLATNLVYLAVGLGAEVINYFIDHRVCRSVQFTLKDMRVDIPRSVVL